MSIIPLFLFFLQSIISFDPADDKYSISSVNTKLSNLFLLATGPNHTLNQSEFIQHTFNVNAKILQPESWARWVSQRKDDFHNNLLTNCRDSALLKCNKICTENAWECKGSSSTVAEDVVSMLATSLRPRHGIKRGTLDLEEGNDYGKKRYSGKDDDEQKSDLPSFIKYTKDSSGVAYKSGDIKTCKEETWYFFNCLHHRNSIRWHNVTAR